MRRPGFLEGVGVALAASLLGGLLHPLLGLALGGGALLRLLIAALALGYLLYLLRRSPSRIGRPTVVALWLVVAVAIWVVAPPLGLYLSLHAGMIWLVRALYFYGALIPILADLGLSAVAVLAAIWAVLNTGSLFLAIWCFFLVQALFVAIPVDLRGSPAEEAVLGSGRFTQAQRSAEAALRKLSTAR